MDGQHSVWGYAHSTSFSVLRRASHEGRVRDKHFPPGRNDHIVQHAHQSHRAHVSLWILSVKFLWECPLVHSANTNHNKPQRSVFVQDICRLFKWCLFVVTTKQRMKFCIQIWNRYYLERLLCNTECGRKNSSIWEANKLKTKEDTAHVFLFLERTQNTVLHQCILNKSSLKWRSWILINLCSLSVVVHDLENHFRCTGSNFLSYRLLQSFQSFSCLSKVWYPRVNRFLIRNSLPSTKRKADAKCTLRWHRRPAIFYKLLNNKGLMFPQPHHGIHWKRHVHRCSTTCSQPLYALLTRSYDPPNLGCSFCRNLYYSPTWCCLFPTHTDLLLTRL